MPRPAATRCLCLGWEVTEPIGLLPPSVSRHHPLRNVEDSGEATSEDVACEREKMEFPFAEMEMTGLILE